jgi:transcriptional repressor NrdR
MVCVHCGAKTRVLNSRWQRRSNQIWRRRKCLKCGSVFTTEEIASYGAAWVVRGKNGPSVPFSRDKLFLSLYKSCQHRQTALEDAGALTDTIINKLVSHVHNGVIDSATMAQVVRVALNRFDGVASVHYQAFHGG